MGVADEQFEAASSFLDPVLKPSKPEDTSSDVSLSKVLLPRCDASLRALEFAPQTIVALQALSFLLKLDKSLKAPDVLQADVDEVFRTPSRRRILQTLVDVVSIEGIHSYLESGVGLPIQHRLQSTFKGWEMLAKPQSAALKWDDGAWRLCQEILDLQDETMLSALLDDRILVDYLALLLQAAYMPSLQLAGAKQLVERSLDSIQTSKVLKTVASLMHSATPEWLRFPLSAILARAPMRHNGVRDTINFLASSQQPRGAPAKPDSSKLQEGPVISNQILEQAAQVLAAVPAGVEAGAWFETVGVQLLSLLSTASGDDQKMASYIIGTILSRRTVGSHGTPGWRWLALPILGNINPNEAQELPTVWPTIESAIAPENALQWAISCLARLLLLHPNPGLVKRLTSRIFTNLWSIACVARQSKGHEQVTQICIKLLQSFTAAADYDVVVKLLSRFFVNGTSEWSFALINAGQNQSGISIIREQHSFPNRESDLELLQKLESNMLIILEIVAPLSEDAICKIFADVLDAWHSAGSKKETKVIGAGNEMPLQLLVYTNALQSLLEKYQSVLVRQPLRMLSVTTTLLKSSLASMKSKAAQETRVNMIALHSIATNPSNANAEDESFSEELLSFCFGLLSVILNEKNFSNQAIKQNALLTELRDTLSTYNTLPSLGKEFVQQCQLLLARIDSLQNVDDMEGVEMSDSSKKMEPGASATENDDVSAYQTAVENIRSPLPPIRTEGLTQLDTLLRKSAKVALVSSTLTILLALLEENDEYSYLGAMNSISLFAKQRPDTTIPQLVDAYLDTTEIASMETRLRLGESIVKVLHDMGPELSREEASRLTQGMLKIASRRTKREAELKRRELQIKQEEREHKRAAREWGGEVLELPPEFHDEVTAQDEVAARILERWAGSGKEEDLRIRASALSILGIVLSTAVVKLDGSLVQDSIELCLLVLQHETDEGAAILRRAAVAVFNGLFSGLEGLKHDYANADFAGFNIPLDKIMRVLEITKNDDADEIVRGHAFEVLRLIEQSQISAAHVKLQSEGIRTDLGGRLRGLAINVDSPSSSSKPRVEELD